MNNYSHTPQANPIGSSSPYPRHCGILYLIHSPQELDYIPLQFQSFGDFVVGGICPETEQIYLRVYSNGNYVTTSYSLNSQTGNTNTNTKTNTGADVPVPVDVKIQHLESRIQQLESHIMNSNGAQGGRYNELLQLQ